VSSSDIGFVPPGSLRSRLYLQLDI